MRCYVGVEADLLAVVDVKRGEMRGGWDELSDLEWELAEDAVSRRKAQREKDKES